jgi:TolB-like protein/Flp pilus assembly protein TadD
VSLLSELKRRNVIRVAIAYAVAAWLVLQVIDVILPILEIPNWVAQLVLLLLILGFIAALVISWAYEMTPEGLRRESDLRREESITHHTARKLDWITIVLLLVVGAVVVIDRFIPETVESKPVEATGPAAKTEEGLQSAREPELTELVKQDQRQSVAVIPFVNMSDDLSNEYFSDGISEELLNVLVRIESLRVPSRTSSFTFKGSDKKLLEIGRELGVEHILEGSVRKAGDRIRVTAQLVEVSTDTHLWSETYTRSLNDIFAVQDEIAQSIVEALQHELSSKGQQDLTRRSTSNVEAYNLLLRGRYLWQQRTTPTLLAAIEPLREAVSLDPQFVDAWNELANAYMAIPDYDAGPAEKYAPLALEATKTALALDPDSAHALANMAYLKATTEFDWAGANAMFERALAVEPNNALFHQWYGSMLNNQDKLDKALEHLAIARSLDPMSMIIRHIPGYFLLWRFRLDEAEVHYKDAAELGQKVRWSYHNLDFLNCFRGNWDEARRNARQLAEMEGYDPAADLARIDAMENPALRERALLLLEQRRDIGDTVFGKALQYAVLQEHERALEILEKAYEAGDSYITHINYMKVFDPLRDNPRFQALLRNMNLLQ